MATPTVLDNLIAAGAIPPVVVVMISLCWLYSTSERIPAKNGWSNVPQFAT